MKIALRLLATTVVLAFAVLAMRFYIFLPDGKALFTEQGCVRCHVFKGVGRGAIDLSHVSEEWSSGRIRDQIRNPRVNNPATGMPNFGHLTDREVDALVRFLKGQA